MRCDSWPLVPEGDEKTFTGRSSGLSRSGAFPFQSETVAKVCRNVFCGLYSYGDSSRIARDSLLIRLREIESGTGKLRGKGREIFYTTNPEEKTFPDSASFERQKTGKGS